MGPILAPEEGLGPLYREVHVGWTPRVDCSLEGLPLDVRAEAAVGGCIRSVGLLQ